MKPASLLTKENLLTTQGVYYACTGIWPLLHMKSFIAVTGPKSDLWLVHTVGILVTAIGGALIRAGRRRNETAELLMLAAGASFGLAAIEIRNVFRKRIRKIYLADAAVEIALGIANIKHLKGSTQEGVE